MFERHGAERILADHVADRADKDRKPADGVIACGQRRVRGRVKTG